MHDTTIKKVEAGSSPRGEMGQKYLVAGKRVSMRLWKDEPGGKLKGPTTRDYETVGYVISGSAKLDLEGQTLNLKAGDSCQNFGTPRLPNIALRKNMALLLGAATLVTRT